MAKDKYHEIVKDALIKDGWTITHDPFRLLSKVQGGLETDLGAEKVIVAEKGLRKIAVEVKSFLHPSAFHDLERAIGQYGLYTIALEMAHEPRTLFLAMPDEVYSMLIEKEVVRRTIQAFSIKILLYVPESKTIKQWIE